MAPALSVKLLSLSGHFDALLIQPFGAALRMS